MELTYRSGGAEALWKPTAYPVYLFFGEEDRLKEEAVAALTTYLIPPDAADFDVETFEATDANVEAILASAAQAPFFSERRVVVVKGAETWRERGRESEVERLAEAVGKWAGATCLILSAAAGEEEAKRKTAVSVKLDNAVKKVGALIKCEALKGASLTSWIAGRAKSEGKKIEGGAVELLIESVGEEMLPLEQEILKLVCYVGDRPTITPQDVSLVTAASPEDALFQVIDAVTKRQTDKALLLLAELHRYDPKPQAVAGKLLTLLARQYRMLWQAKYLAEKRIHPRDVRSLPPDLAAELPSEGNIAQVAFKAGDLFALSRTYAWSEIHRALELLLLCDLANKGGVTDESSQFSADPQGNLRLLLLELTGATKTPSRASR